MTGSTPVWQRVAAAAGLMVLAPILGVAAVVIRRSDPGPVIYRADRSGAGGRPFCMYKLRTMRLRSDSEGLITTAGDNRVTPAGGLLRRLKLDEVPQLANVLRGEMALVGPRPEARRIVEDHYQPWMLETLTVPPGITGPGSLHYIDQERAMRSHPDEALSLYLREVLPRKLAYDLVYVRNRSTPYELSVILRTLLGVVRRNVDEASAASHWERIEAEQILAELARPTDEQEMRS